MSTQSRRRSNDRLTAAVESLEPRRLLTGVAFAPQTPISVGNAPSAEVVGDFNADGHPDIAVTNYNGNSVTILLGNGDGTFATGQTIAVGTHPTSIAVGNFTSNSNGHLDLAVADRGSSKISILLGNGDGTFSSGSFFSAGYQAHTVAVADLNGDGKADLISVDRYGVEIFLGNGDGTFAYHTAIATDFNPKAIAVGDFNGDHNLDLAVGNYNEGTISILLGNGDGNFAPKTTIPVSSDLLTLAAADFNGDGKTDLAVGYANQFNQGYAAILLSNGDGAFAAQHAVYVGSGINSMVAGDFNGDGHQDIAVSNYSSNNVRVLLGNGNGTLASPTTVDSISHANGLVTADFNGDGEPDLAAASKTGNAVTVLLQSVSPVFASNASGVLFTNTPGLIDIIAQGSAPIAITESGNLPAGISFHDNGNGTAALSGTATAEFPDDFALTFTASNGVIPNTTQSFALTVATAPTFTSGDSATFVAGVGNQSFGITATGAPFSPTISESGALPSGVSFQANMSGGASLSGTPAADAGGTYIITLTAAGDLGPNATQNFTLTITQQAVITSAASTTFAIGSTGTFTVTSTGFPTNSLTEAGTLPSGVLFVDNGNNTVTLSGTPTQSGVFPITITAHNTNEFFGDAVQEFTLTVAQQPAFTSLAASTFTEGFINSFAIVTTGAPTNIITESGALPAGVSFNDDTNDDEATLSGNPTQNGVFPITLTAHNGVGPDAVQNFTLTVDQAAAITTAAATMFTVGTSGLFTVTTTGFPDDTITESGALPSGVSLVDNGNNSATLAGTPTQGGAFPITLTAHNAVSSDAVQHFTLTVDQAPAISTAAAVTFTVGTHGVFTINTTGTPDDAITESGTLPAGVSLQDNGNNSATLFGTPTQNGVFQITLTAHNGVSPDAVQHFTLTVDQAPAITTPAFTTFATGTAGLFLITTTGFPTPTFVETGALPPGVIFTDKLNGKAKLSGTPTAGGTYTITVKANNGISPHAVQTFTLTVDQAPTITSANTTTFTKNVAGKFVVTTTGFPIPALSEIGNLPAGVSFVDRGNGRGQLLGTPARGTNGTYPITIKATKGTKPNATQSFTLIVRAPAAASANLAPAIAAPQIISSAALAPDALILGSAGNDTILC